MARRANSGRPRPGGPAGAAQRGARRAAAHPVARPGPRPAAALVDGAGAGSRGRLLAVLDGKRYLPCWTPSTPCSRTAAAQGRRPGARQRPGRRCSRTTSGSPAGSEAALAHAGRARTGTWPCTRPARPPSAPGTRPRRPARRSASPAKRSAKRLKAVQTLLGDHQDSVVAREALRELAVQAHAAGESAFTWGCCTGARRPLAERRSAELPEVVEKARRPGAAAGLRGGSAGGGAPVA